MTDKHIVMVQHIDGKQDIDPDIQWANRTVYLTTIVDNGFEPDALIQHSTPDTVAEARADAKHDLDWFGIKQGFKVTCRISIDNVFEEISEYDPKVSQRWSTDAEREAWKQEAAENGARLAEEMVDECHKWQDQTADYNAFNGIIEASIDLEDTPRDWKDLRGDCAL